MTVEAIYRHKRSRTDPGFGPQGKLFLRGRVVCWVSGEIGGVSRNRDRVKVMFCADWKH